MALYKLVIAPSQLHRCSSCSTRPQHVLASAQREVQRDDFLGRQRQRRQFHAQVHTRQDGSDQGDSQGMPFQSSI